MSPFLAVVALSASSWTLTFHPPPSLSLLAPTQVAQVAEVDRAVLDEPFIPRSDRAQARLDETQTRLDHIRGFQIATNLAMATTVSIGAIMFADRFGFHSQASETACGQGDAILGYCADDTAYAYLGAAGTTAALALTSFVLWTQLDVDLARQLDSDIPVYAVTRLVARVMNAVGALFGFLYWNAVDWGWADEQADFSLLQGMGIAHQVWGAATLGLETVNTVLIL